MTEIQQHSIPVEWTRVEVTREIASTNSLYVEYYVKQTVRAKYADVGEVPVRIEWVAWKEVIPGVPERIRDWHPSQLHYGRPEMPSAIFCQGRPDVPSDVIEYITVDEPGDRR